MSIEDVYRQVARMSIAHTDEDPLRRALQADVDAISRCYDRQIPSVLGKVPGILAIEADPVMRASFLLSFPDEHRMFVGILSMLDIDSAHLYDVYPLIDEYIELASHIFAGHTASAMDTCSDDHDGGV